MFERCQRVRVLMKGYKRPWAIAGGWAIDLHIGKEMRLHSDLEIAIFREDQHELKQYLHTWDLRKVVNGKFENWTGEKLTLPIHELHGAKEEEEIEILLNEANQNEWIFRRDPKISFPKEKLILSSNGIPYLHPAVVLLYKVKHMREKDHQDFIAVKNCLAKWERQWLCRALTVHQPDHLWMEQLGGKQS